MSKETPKRARSTLQDLLRAASALDAMPALPEEALHRFLEDAVRHQDRQERIKQEAQVAACRAMIQMMPSTVRNPESVAGEAYGTFSRSLRTSYSEQDTKYMGGRLRRTTSVLAKTLGRLNHDMANLPEMDYALLSGEALKYGIDLSLLCSQLQALETITVNASDKVTSPGRTKDHNTAAALDAAQYLMDQDIKRQRAAKIVAALTLHHPDVEAKGWRTIQAAMVDAGITARTKKSVNRGWGGHILLTPG